MNDQVIPPFVGLRPFNMSDHHWFHGRDQEISILLRKIFNHRFTAVVGASGSGKSSLVCAGILPRLKQEKWQSILVRPGSAPIAKLAWAFSEAALEETSNALIEARAYRYDTILRQSTYGLTEIAEKLASEAPKLILVVDQFEELFRYGEEARGLKKAAMAEESRAFVEQLLIAASHPAGRVHVVITMRSDFFGNCTAYSGLAEAVSNSQYLVPLPSRAQLEKIIRGPIDDAGGQIDTMLVQRLLLDVEEEIDLLPTLQHTLRRLWEVAQGEPKHLLDEDYKTIGGIKGSIHVKAEKLFDSFKSVKVDLFKKFPKDTLIILEIVMKAITTLDEQDRATRRPQKQSTLLNLATEVLGNRERAEASLNHVLETLSSENASFIQLGTDDDREIDIYHEALIRSWQRLCGEQRDFKTGWLFEEREDGQQWRELVRHTRKKQPLSFSHAWHFRKWIRKKKLGSEWCNRYGNSWEAALQFCRKSLILSGVRQILISLFIFPTFVLFSTMLYFALFIDF